MFTGKPRFCEDETNDKFIYNVTRANRFHVHVCGNPLPKLSIKHHGKDIAVREIIEDQSQKYRYRYSFDLHDLQTSDCSSAVMMNIHENERIPLAKSLELISKFVLWKF